MIDLNFQHGPPQSTSLHLPHQRVRLNAYNERIEKLEGVHQVSASQRAKEICH